MTIKTSKYLVLKTLERWLREKPALKILDLGCGEPQLFLKLLYNYPHCQYLGIEPEAGRAQRARQLTKDLPNVTIKQNLAYGQGFGSEEFDVVVSLSTLEHVKNLQKFLIFSANYLKSGGQMIHLYDLGHALFPGSVKERLHVWLSQNSFFSRFIPETKYCGYVAEAEAVKILNDNGVAIKEITYHNNPHLVSFIKKLDNSASSQAILDRIIEFELMASKLVKELPPAVREKLFPSICLWGVKGDL